MVSGSEHGRVALCTTTAMLKPTTIALLQTALIAAIFAAVVLLASVLAAQTESTCLVRCAEGNGAYSCGSGVLIAHGKGEAEGYSVVATAAHVVQTTRGSSITVQFHGTSQRIPCRLVGFDSGNDVAVLSCDAPDDIKPAPVSTQVAVGDRVAREGYPHASGLRVTKGAVRSLSQRYGGGTNTLVTVDRPATSGESGGPVYDDQGCVVGLVCTTDSTESSGPSGKSILAVLPDDSWRVACQICLPADEVPPAPRMRNAPVPSTVATPKASPVPTVDYAALAKALAKELASDPRFRGPAGPAGPAGKPGPTGPAGPAGRPGDNGRDIDPAQLADIEARLQEAYRRIDVLKNSTFSVEIVSPSGDVLTGEVHAHGGLLRLDSSF